MRRSMSILLVMGIALVAWRMRVEARRGVDPGPATQPADSQPAMSPNWRKAAIKVCLAEVPSASAACIVSYASDFGQGYSAEGKKSVPWFLTCVQQDGNGDYVDEFTGEFSLFAAIFGGDRLPPLGRVEKRDVKVELFADWDDDNTDRLRCLIPSRFDRAGARLYLLINRAGKSDVLDAVFVGPIGSKEAPSVESAVKYIAAHTAPSLDDVARLKESEDPWLQTLGQALATSTTKPR